MWWDKLPSADQLIALIHEGLSSFEARGSIAGHGAPPLARRVGVEPVAAAAGADVQALGYLSMKYETGFLRGQEAAAAATVSHPKNDKGGMSYGAFQLNSADSVVNTFLANEGAPMATGFAGLNAKVPGPFEKEWKRVAAANPSPFFEAQRAFIERTHYAPLVAGVLADTQVDLGGSGYGVREALFSMSVQHGLARSKIVDPAVKALSGHGSPGEKAYDTLLINKLYDLRAAYFKKLKLDYLIPTRCVAEQKDALALITDAAP